jgi:hypothetical protein
LSLSKASLFSKSVSSRSAVLGMLRGRRV